MTDPSTTSNIGSANIYALDASDPNSRLIDRAAYPPEIIAQISELMGALGTLRAAEQHLSETAQQAMQLGQTDMQALHFLIVAQHTEVIATPGAIAAQLRISTASTTKLLDRLEAAGHILRAPHPSDRRALAITITEQAYEAALETVGRQQAKRFHAAARLTTAERDIVIGFLHDMNRDLTAHDEA